MVSADLLASYASIRPILEALRNRVAAILGQVAEDRHGLYLDRIKEPDSIFEKALLGKYQRPLETMEDLVGATLVLPRIPVADDRDRLEAVLKERFEITQVRSNRTERPTEFRYDHLHYILRLKDSALLSDKRLLNWQFELQVKSLLEHAWAQSTRELAYKTVRESWRATRVVAQSKALVETLEAALARGETLLPETAVQSYKPIDERVAVVEQLERWWKGILPSDHRRLGLFVIEYLRAAESTVAAFAALLETPRGLELASKASLTVQQAILILLLETWRDKIVDHLKREGDRFLVVTSEMESLSSVCRELPADIRVVL